MIYSHPCAYQRILLTAALAITLVLNGCASLLAPPVNPGDTENDVLSKLGPPRHRYEDGAAHVLDIPPGRGDSEPGWRASVQTVDWCRINRC